MFCYKTLVDQLNSETRKLKNEEGNMSREVEKEKKNGKIIKDYVSEWQVNAQEIQKSAAEELSPSCSCIKRLPIPNPISRFRIGRNAVKKAKAVTQLTDSVKEHLTGGIAYLPEVIILPNSGTTFEEFQSRKDTYQKLWDSLVNEDGPLIHGIYGMAGVGKTRMMEQLWEEAIKKKIINKAVRVNVGSENMDKTKLQEQIAGLLDCKLESEVMERRASQLENSLRNGDKVLLILDDVWRDIHLDDIIGTPFGNGTSSSGGPKILFTSRTKEVCSVNKCQHIVEIKTLSPDEALYMFKKIVGPADLHNSLPDESLVKEVCDKCGELPLLIHAVGKALKGKPHYWWKDAQDQLKKGKFEEIADVDPQVYTCIKLSIDYLQNVDAKSCLFLCSMFPEDAGIDMKMLIQLATGSQLIPSGESRVLAIVDYLKKSSLLLDSGDNAETKVHDIIRDVARSIAFTDSKYAFLQVTCNSRYLPFKANYSTRRFLRLDVETDDVDFGEHRVCPDLHTLWLQSNFHPLRGQSNNHPQQFSGGFYSMFVNLSCLMLQNVDISSEHFSLQPLGNLGTLSLLECDISSTDARLFSKSLESLCLYRCNLPEPLDVANLEYLRKLEIRQQRAVLVRENVISSLSSLEELHVPRGFIYSYDEYHMELIVKEISRLTRLTSLHFEFYQDNTFQGTDISFNIDRYNIFVVERSHDYFHCYEDREVLIKRSIELADNHWKPWEDLIVSAEQVTLSRSNVNVSSICNDHKRAFKDLKILDIDECDNMGHLASISRDGIQDSVQSATWFAKLTILNIRRCSNLKYLFCNNIAKTLIQLQELYVDSCDSMEAIVMNAGTSDGEIINFAKLKLLEIEDMPKLRSFCAENSNYPSAQYLALLDRMVAFPSLEHIRVIRCGSLRSMFASSVARDLKQLKGMIVKECKEMRRITRVDEQAISGGILLFPELTYLELVDLPNLMSFWSYQNLKPDACKDPLIPQLSSNVVLDIPDLKSFFDDQNFELYMPDLEEVIVDNCQITTLFTFSVFKKFQLNKLSVSSCEFLVNIIEDLRCDQICDKIITLSHLTEVDLNNLPNVKRFFHVANYEFHMPILKRVNICECGISDTLFTRSIFKNLQQLEELHVSDCELLDGIFEDAICDEILDTSDKIITLNRVTDIYLYDLPKFKSVFYGATYECHMPALRNVTIFGCSELHILFTCSVFREIRQIQNLCIVSCESLEHIVKEVEGDGTFGKSITFPHLKSVEFMFLRNLKSFSYSRSFIFNMPKLQYFNHCGCYKIEYFSFLDTSAPFVSINAYRNRVGPGLQYNNVRNLIKNDDRFQDGMEEAFQYVNDYVRELVKARAARCLD
nr:PREDICTED: probable disease resistance protein At4g27220 isoform X1 [Daucus carota subsp. sativus]